MKLSNISTLLLSFVFLCLHFEGFSQSKTEIDMIGEYHYYYGNNAIKNAIIDSLIACNRDDTFIIAIESPPTLEYFMSIDDSDGIEKYFLYNSDNKLYKLSCSDLNKISYNFVTSLLDFRHKLNVSIKCIDAFYTNRSIIFTIHRIFEKYTIFHDSFYDKMGLIIQQPTCHFEAERVIDTLKSRINSERYYYRKQMDSIDFYYLNRFINTPIYSFENVFDLSRDEYMYNQICKLNNKTKKVHIICINGNAHVKRKKGNLYNILEKDDVFNVTNIGIIPVDLSKMQWGMEFDKVFINKGSNIFSQ